MQINIYMTHMIMKTIISLIIFLTLSGCAISPGMHLDDIKKGKKGTEFVHLRDSNTKIEVINIGDANESLNLVPYRIGNGDKIVVTVWGYENIFPSTYGTNENAYLRTVGSDGMMYFPFVGKINAVDKTASEIRDIISLKLEESFNKPQVDVTVAQFNSQKIYVLGEVTIPQKINLNDIPLSLSDAIGEVKGLRTETADGKDVFVVRSFSENEAKIFRADLSSPVGFVQAENFYLRNNDIVFVNASGTARWNKVISQFFPFSTFINSVDSLIRNSGD